ncbi:probable E3 ubiquitin-protein ligase makorin-1 [Quercus lobata]|uniref:probable E3 ubiquitin-protein ligase makorin-1 n=1 Tax=Quercus lobata TaxID=97700 RepID=UPI001246E670|nr:probable E3 ubiquitin-protein ligase makorin-1 [Quercus lobata]XP_030963876.1 probable E3 ubiquitin-protein ligase makorin-1 [Quercus lobata]
MALINFVEEKQDIVDSYKAKLKSIDCKHFDFGNGNCPFGSSCFYKMSRCSSRGKDIVIDVPSSPVSKRTRCSSQESNSERFRTPLDSQTHSRIFQKAPIVVEQVVKFETLVTTFIPRIFEAKDWADLFENFEDLIDELVKKFYSNVR